MPLKILDLGRQFRPKTSIIYPPFKNGRYMEEYFYDYSTNPENNNKIESDRIYIPAFWTNIQNHPNFSNMKESLNIILQRKYISIWGMLWRYSYTIDLRRCYK